MPTPKEIIATLENKIATLEASLESVSDPEITARNAIKELGGYPRAGVKVVGSDYRPNHRAKEFHYAPGNTLTADDWENFPSCGRGLHYSDTVTESKGYFHSYGGDWRAVIVVATGENVIIDDSKSKAETLRVDREIDISDWNKGMEVRAEIAGMRRAISEYYDAQKVYKQTLKELRKKG